MENYIDDGCFALALNIERLSLQNNNQAKKIKQLLNQLLQLLGYQDIKDTHYANIADYVAEITEHKMKSFDYLRHSSSG